MAEINAQNVKIHPTFLESFKNLFGKKIIDVCCIKMRDNCYFEMHIGNQRLCWDYHIQHGKTVIVSIDEEYV